MQNLATGSRELRRRAQARGTLAQAAWIDGRQEMPAFDQHVAGDGQLHAGRGMQQRAVVANAQHVARDGALEVAVDQVEFTHVPIVCAFVQTKVRAVAGALAFNGSSPERCGTFG